jgi:tRNA G10  N-methylase Trm11
MKTIRDGGRVVFVTDKSGYSDLRERKDLIVTMLQEFPQWRNKNVYLLSASKEEKPASRAR